jgi:hypothetical protein
VLVSLIHHSVSLLTTKLSDIMTVAYDYMVKQTPEKFAKEN